MGNKCCRRDYYKKAMAHTNLITEIRAPANQNDSGIALNHWFVSEDLKNIEGTEMKKDSVSSLACKAHDQKLLERV